MENKREGKKRGGNSDCLKCSVKFKGASFGKRISGYVVSI
jgi:hypothetical protein